MPYIPNIKIGETIYKLKDTDLAEEVETIRQVLDHDNSVDYVLLYGKHETRTINGVSYSWNSDKTICQVSGTANATSQHSFYYNTSILPDWLKVGTEYTVEYNKIGTTPPVYIQIFGAGESTLYEKYFTKDDSFTVPNGAIGLRIEFRVNNGNSVNGTVAFKMHTVKTNKTLSDEIDQSAELINGLISRTKVNILPRLAEYGNYYVNVNGVLSSSSNWIMYIMPVGVYKNVEFQAYAENLTVFNVAYYSTGTPKDSAFISGLHAEFVGKNTFILNPPNNAKCVALSSRIASGTDHEVYSLDSTIDEINEEMYISDNEEDLKYILSQKNRSTIYKRTKYVLRKFPANSAQAAPNVFMTDNIAVTGGTEINIILNSKPIYYGSNYSSMEYRVFEYDANNEEITRTVFSAIYTNNVPLWLNENTVNIKVSFCPVVPAHVSDFYDLFDTYCAVYTENNMALQLERTIKATIGMNPYFKSIDHGGFWSADHDNYENSPAAFIKAAKEGIFYHNVDIVFSSDRIPFAFHDINVTDINGVALDLTSMTAAEIKQHRIGDSKYSWTIRTLSEINTFIKKIGGCIDMVDISVANDRTRSAADAASLPAYYRQYKINPTWTNFDRVADREAFIANGPEFGVYIVCNIPIATTMQNALTYIQNHPGPKYCVNVYCTDDHESNPDTVNALAKQMASLGVTMYTYIYRRNNFLSAPWWTDGMLSQYINTGYELWKYNLHN